MFAALLVAVALHADAAPGEAMRRLTDALSARRLGPSDAMSRAEVGARVAEAERLLGEGRVDDAVAILAELVESARFQPFAADEPGRAAVVRLGEALAGAGAYLPARAYLRRAVAAKGAWDGDAAYARRAVRRLVEIALEGGDVAGGLTDLGEVPRAAPPDVRAEVAYLAGRARELAGDPEGALAAYASVPATSRFWVQATYLAGLLQIERGRWKEGEDLFCKVADPRRQARTTPVLADARFFAVRDLARLALGRVAHEQGRHDDARYYYYLVPRDSERLAEALYEAATTRYEKKDYEGARALLDELTGLGVHHRYEDEAAILDAYVDLARCRFEAADAKIVAFLARYEPVRAGARRVAESPVAFGALLAAARIGGDAAAADRTAGVAPDVLRAVAALVRVDPAYGEIVRRRAVVERQASGLRHAVAALDDVRRALATSGAVRPAAEREPSLDGAVDARGALESVRRELAEVAAAGAPPERLAPLREELARLEGRVQETARPAPGGADEASAGPQDLAGLVARDASHGRALGTALDAARQELARAEVALAEDALKRLDLRLSRLLRRARLARIESVLGRKRALEIEVEGIGNGYLPPGALDSMDAARWLGEREEYWPFEGDDWPDEFVGGEGPR